jgi:hypothetical protein
VSRVVREAIETSLDIADLQGSPYERVADLIGAVHGRNPKRSVNAGRQFAELLKRRRDRS